MKEEKKENNDNIVYCILKNNLKIIPIKKLPFIIGRKDNCDLFINNPSISKKHSIIQFDEQDEGESNNINKEKNKDIILIDNSLNGSYVNGTKITNGKKILLETDDRMSFGNDKNIYVFELMNYDNDKTIIYPNLLNVNKIETNPISLVNEDYYQKSEINHLNTHYNLKTRNSESNNNISYSKENKINKDKDNEINNSSNEDNNNNNIEKNSEHNTGKKSKEKVEEEKEDKKEEKKDNINEIIENNKLNNNLFNIEQVFSLKKEVFDLKKENDNLKLEINNLKDMLEKKNNNINTINNRLNNNYNDISYKNINTETNNSLNNSNINLLAEDLRELGLFRRIKESLIPNYTELNFEELSLKFDNIIMEYKKKYNIAEILLNMENEFNNEISKFNNIISLQQEQKRDTLNKINYLFKKEDNLEDNNNYSKANKYLIEQLNELISDKETNIKLINQLKGNIIKLKTEINLYKTNNDINTHIKKNNKKHSNENKINNIKSNNNIIKNNLIPNEELLNNYIDYNIDKYSIGYNYNKYNQYSYNENNNKNMSSDYNLNNSNYSYNNNIGKNTINYNENKDENNILDDYKRLNILIQNSQDNQKYKEIIKQKELIVNGMQ